METSQLLRAAFNRRSLMLFLGVYTVLVAWRVARIERIEAPSGYAVGVHGWERGPEDGNWNGHVRFRWTRGRALLLAEIGGPVLRIPLYAARPDLPGARVVLRVSLDGVRAGSVPVEHNGWQEVTYHLPTVLEERRWAAIEAQRKEAAGGVFERSTPRIWVQLEVEPTFVPAAIGPSMDARTLGVGIGDFVWSGDSP